MAQEIINISRELSAAVVKDAPASDLGFAEKPSEQRWQVYCQPSLLPLTNELERFGVSSIAATPVHLVNISSSVGHDFHASYTLNENCLTLRTAGKQQPSLLLVQHQFETLPVKNADLDARNESA
eukprot:6196108-Pleurochrysis_carterae.AAC.2